MITLPTAEVWPEMMQGSEQWFAARRGRATASQFKKILTPTGALSKQADAYARKLARECVLDDPFEFAGNKATDWGNTYEPEARDIFRGMTRMKVVEIGFATHRHMTCVGCSPDGIIIEGGAPVAGLEIKCPAPDTLVEWALAGTLPPEHMPQVHGSMVVTGLRRWEFIAYFPGAPVFRAHAVWDDYTDKLKTALEEFVIRYAEIRPRVLKLLGKGAV
ncbi:MAG: YqaJ viral recombinase family protein [Acidobacteriales bacterium]|nr:YqaJ viral recombinase family protein [Terriglobales bacterium]